MFGLSPGKKNSEHGAYALQNAGAHRYPVLISVPHAARQYPRALTENLRIPADALLRLEDRYADMLSRKAAEAGFAVITAKAPRAWIDMNRAPGDIDADMLDDADTGDFGQISAKARGGLGLVPRRLSGYGDIWKNKWKRADFDERVAHFHAPYHEKVGEILKDIHARHGCAVLLDLHSMPTVVPQFGEEHAEIVIGDRFGRSASGRMSETAMAVSQQPLRGARNPLTCRLNHPYAGGYILERHGRPNKGIHAIQLEIDRALYLDREAREPTHGVNVMAEMVLGMALALSEEAAASGFAQAAE